MTDSKKSVLNELVDTPIAHRGLFGDGVPENSVGAFEAAADAGFPIELDVRQTKDGALVVIHDRSTGRMTREHMKVSESTMAELTDLYLLGTMYRIPSLMEALKVIGSKVPVVIEIKTPCKPSRLGPVLMAELARHDGEYAVASFDPRMVRWLTRHAPQVVRGQHAGSVWEHEVAGIVRWFFRTIPIARWSKPQFLLLDIRDYPQDKVERWSKKLGIPVILWSISTKKQLHVAKESGLNYMFDHVRP